MVGTEVSTEELQGSAAQVYHALSKADATPAQKRAELTTSIGFVEQDLFKEAIRLVNLLQEWRGSAGLAPLDLTSLDGLTSDSVAISHCVVQRDRGMNWGQEMNSLPLFESDSESEEEEEAAFSGAPVHDMGGGGGPEQGEAAEWVQARILEHCAMVGLPGEDVTKEVYAALASRQTSDEVQARLFDLLGMDGLELIAQLLQHRNEVVRWYLQSKNPPPGGEKGGRAEFVGAFSVMTSGEQKMQKQQRKEERKRRKDMAGQEQEVGSYEEWLRTQGFDAEALRMQREAELAAGPTTSNRQTTFDGSVAGFAGAQGIVLPEGTKRTVHKKDGYEEINVPPQKAALKKSTERLVAVTEFSEFCQPAFEGMASLNRVQSIVFPVGYKSGNNMLVCAPTGAGKTECAMMTVLHQLEQHLDRGVLRSDEFKIVYVAPMKALAAEVTEKFSKRLSRLGLVVKELTGDMQLSRREITDTHMLVVTPEKWDVMTRKSSDAALTSLVKLLIIDEIHLLNEDRGAVLEAIVARTLRQVESSQSMIRIVGLSATLPTYKDVAVFLRVNVDRDLFYFDNAYRPVPLETAFLGVMGNNQGKVKATMTEITYKKVLERVRQGHQVMVFVHSRKDTYKTAKTLMEMAQQEGTISAFEPKENPKYSQWEKQVIKSRNREVKELFSAGFGVHHAGILRSDRTMVEKLFGEGLLRVLCCTATLAWGVNLPAHSVIIKGTQVYDAKQGKFVELGVLDVMQIFGRAGRPQFDSSGEGIIITTHDKLNHYLRLMHNALPIESQLLPSITDHLNAEVVLGTVRNTQEAIAWLSYTYLYVRMLRNPTNYGVAYHEIESDPTLRNRCRELIELSVKELARAKMLRFNFDTHNMNTTDTGIVASHYYVKYASLELYNELVHPAMSEADCFDVVSRSSEFENVQAREEENQELLKLLTNACPIKIKTQIIEGEGVIIDQIAKVNILLQSYISRADIDGFALVADSHHVVQSAGRIFRALFELAIKKGWVTLGHRLLTICKVVDRRLWHHQHPLRQFGHVIPAEWLYRLEERKLTLERLVDMEPIEVSGILRQNRSGLLIQQYVGQFPYLDVQAAVQPITRTILRVTLTIRAQFEWSDRVHGTVEPFWVWVEDNENERIYHTEYFLLHKRQKDEAHTLAFTVPIFEPLESQYIVRAVSDRWLNAETIVTLSLGELTLPDKYPPHTTLLKLCPLPKAALQNAEFERLYRFTHFNAIQTQVFHALYHTDANVLLGAPTGSGKTNCAELAILRLFRTRPKAKVVYVAPMKALVRERMKDWSVRLAKQLGKNVVELTGDVSDMGQVERADVIVTTPEKWDGVSRGWQSRKYVQAVGLVVIDEIHLLGEDRGPVLEVIVSRMRYISAQTSSHVRFLGMSTAIANAKDVADWLGAEEGGVFNFHPSVRPVPMQVHIQGYEGKHYCPRMATMNKPTFAALQDYSHDQPAIVFVSSRRQTRLTALDLIQLAAQTETPRRFIKLSEDEIDPVLAAVKDPNLRHTLAFGIGLHHAGLNESDRALVENLFEQCKILVLVSTSTLAWGVNLPAHLVVIKGTEFYDAPSKRYVDFPITDVLQMMGRAGRPQYDTVGVAVVMVHAPKKSFYKRFLYEPFPVESALADCLHNHINAEIVTGTIRSRANAIDYLTWTYLFRRLLCNPSYYHLLDTSKEGMTDFLAALVERTLQDLEDCECIEMEEDSIKATTLGRIAGYYYLDYTTVHMFAQRAEEIEDEEIAIEILGDAKEFSELPVRHNEDGMNADLAKTLRYGAGAGAMDSAHTKTRLLIQAHIGRNTLPIADYYTDLRSVLEQTGRVTQALVDICADLGFLKASLSVMKLAQSMAQCVWAADSSLSTLPLVSPEAIKSLAKSGVMSLRDLMLKGGARPGEAAAVLRKAGLGARQATAAEGVLDQLPLLRVEGTVQWAGKAGLVAGEEGEVVVRIYQDNRRKRGSKAFTPKLTRPKDEGWWLVLGWEEGDELLALKRIAVRRQQTSATLSFLAPEQPGPAVLRLMVVSDCYLGLDAATSLQVALLDPAKAPAPKEA